MSALRCHVDGCTNPHRAHGYCARHITEARAGAYPYPHPAHAREFQAYLEDRGQIPLFKETTR